MKTKNVAHPRSLGILNLNMLYTPSVWQCPLRDTTDFALCGAYGREIIRVCGELGKFASISPTFGQTQCLVFRDLIVAELYSKGNTRAQSPSGRRATTATARTRGPVVARVFARGLTLHVTSGSDCACTANTRLLLRQPPHI